MKAEYQRVLIGEIHGWTFHPPFDGLSNIDYKAEALACWVKPGNSPHQTEILPDYLNDLDAMHEVEKLLSVEQWISYWSFLEPLVCRPNNTPIIFATATQRAEAFLKTFNFWID